MLVLALESSSQAGSVALLECHAGEGEAPAEPPALQGKPAVAPLDSNWVSDNVLSQRVLAADRRSAQTLIPAIGQVLSEARHKPADVGLVAVTVGPGSFTGLRVGVTAAKSLAYATGCQCLGVDTLDVIAEQALAESGAIREVHAVLDAQRKELFLARFSCQAGRLVRLAENRIVPVEAWLGELALGTLVTGTGIDRLVDRLPARVFAAQRHLRHPHAVAVGRLAWQSFQTGRRDDLWTLAPKYLRPSAAEEKAGQAADQSGSAGR